ncbi:hypothetical protein OJF2_03220 [Aquisphaera giovannonii]|uniref:Uncharacterized protein n=2 Tax=Aquisphaera giovannonii TaxID=406548 RepID=A0A5B9VVP5_9BACT|nr:hypothetical protein OJF2_03220 [Aquisphaera giovannonii]
MRADVPPAAGPVPAPGLRPPEAARPLIRPAPRSAVFFPLVVLVAILPGLVALNSWDLTPPGPLWGLRALAVLDDGLLVDQVPAADAIGPAGEAMAYRAVSYQPPLYAWLAAVGMGLSADHDPIGSVLPSYIAGTFIVMLAYLHGRLWRGGGVGFAAALLVGFNPNLLLRMQEATPTTLAVAATVAALLCYGRHLRATRDLIRSDPWARPAFWAVAEGACLGLALLTLDGFGLVVVPIAALHRLYIGPDPSLYPTFRPRPGARGASRSRRWPWPRRLARRLGAAWVDTLLVVALAALIAVPWQVAMFRAHGWDMLSGLEFPSWSETSSLPARLFELAPVTLPLGLYGAARAFRLGLMDDENTPETVGGAFWLLWLCVAALLPAFWPAGPRGAMDLLLLVPLNLLAASTVADLVNRRIPVRALIALAPATAFSVMWWASADLRGAVGDLAHGRASAATALGVHLAFDLAIVSILLTRRLEIWSRRKDVHRRIVLAGFLLTVLAITVGTGVQEVVFRHSETHELLALRTMILRRNREHPFESLSVVRSDLAAASDPARSADLAFTGGWLRFILRTALPHLAQHDLRTVDELLAEPDGRRLILFTGAGERPSYPVKSKLHLEAIHPGRTGILDAYATAQDDTRR